MRLVAEFDNEYSKKFYYAVVENLHSLIICKGIVFC